MDLERRFINSFLGNMDNISLIIKQSYCYLITNYLMETFGAAIKGKGMTDV